ncbi:MAG: hypothetical protein ACFN4S_11815, partial [Prevotella conceptionensis]
MGANVGSFGIIIHFAAFIVYPLLASKQTSARIDFLRQGGRLVDKMGTFSVKLFAEKWTKRESASWQVGKPIGIWLGKLARLAFLFKSFEVLWQKQNQ